MAQRAGVMPAQVRVIHAADRATQDGFFATEIAGNRVANFGLVELGSARLKMALAETDGGAIFPFQYHLGGVEMAVIISGAGAIEVGEDQGAGRVYEFTSGDVVIVPPDLVYRVCNRRSEEKLLAWVFFAEGTASYWPDGSRA
jgi:mannose-6-phosphate isomerase-like protein (cupin superfamily)